MRWPRQLARDLRHSGRAIAAMPVLATVVVVSLGAGIGVNAVVFSWLQSRVWKPLPGVADGARFHGIEPRTPAGLYPGASWPEYRDLRAGLESFDSVIASSMFPAYVGPPRDVERVFGLITSANYFEALGVRPVAGRLPAEAEMADASGQAFAVISHGLWQRRYQGASGAIGQVVRVNGADLTIAAVVPDEFQGTTLGLQFDVFVPIGHAALVSGSGRAIENRSVRGLSVLGLLPEGGSRDAAQAEVDALMRQLDDAHPATNDGLVAEVLPFWQSPRGPQRMIVTALVVLQAIMLLVLAGVCGNTATLMLARASARQREMGVRLALGAGPSRIASLLIGEHLLLALAGAAVGAAVGVWGTGALRLLPMTGVPLRMQTGMDGAGLAFSVMLGVACGLAIGAAPAWTLSRVNPLQALRAGHASAGRSRTRETLMGAQVALAMVLLVGAGLFLRSFLDTRLIDPGFRQDGVSLAAYDFAGRRTSAVADRAFAARVLDRLAAEPGVARAAIASSVPLDIHGLPARIFTIEGRTRLDEGYDEALTNTVTPGYFDVMGLSLVAGRDFGPLVDTPGTAELVVNEEFVRRYVPSGAPLGRRVEVRQDAAVIVGVVEDSTYNAFGEPPQPAMYFSYRDRPMPRGEIHVRAMAGFEGALGRATRAAVAALEPELPVFNVRSLTEHVESNLVFRRIPARMFVVLGPLLLILVSVGIYAVVAYGMALRRTEIGVRLALGASARQVVARVIAETMARVASGAAIGWLVAIAIAFDLAEGGPVDIAVFTAVPSILLAVAVAASWIPARRAARLDPWVTLRER